MKRILSICALLLLVVLAADAADTRSSKRGFSENNLAYVADLQVLSKGCTWFYNWGAQPNSSLNDYIGADKSIEFVPMAWNGSYSIDQLRAYYTAHPNDKYLLGFNEPNFKAQANMTPTQAAEKWPALEALADELGLKLVGPALNYPDGAINDGVTYQPTDWMDQFIAAYKELYGKEPKIDYLALHCYMDYAVAMESFVENFAKRYNKQVWLTEFCAWEDKNITATTQMSHMLPKLQVLEKSSNVFRYAWFKARNSNTYPYYNLVEYPNASKGITAGTLTDLGFAYLHMSKYDTSRYYSAGEKIPVAEFTNMTNLTRIQKSYDPQCTDSVELVLNASNISTEYQINVAEAGTYTFIIRASRGDVTSDALTPRLAIKDADGNTLASKIRIEATGGENVYAATQVQVTLPAGKQTITLAKENYSSVNISMIKFVKTVDANDPDLVKKTTDGSSKGDSGDTGGGDTGGGDSGNKGSDTSSSDSIKVTDAATSPYKFVDGEKYYAIYLDKTTIKANNISDDLLVNCGDNGGTQNSYVWENTFSYGDVTGSNSFGVEGNYIDLIVNSVGWSGMGYNVTGGLDLSGLTSEYSLHMAVKSTSTQTFNFYFTDGQGHVARIILGSTAWDDNGVKYLPVANFARDGKWHNIDIPVSYLQYQYGLNFATDTDYNGNLLCISAGGEAGTEIAYDAIFFHGPANSTPTPGYTGFDPLVEKASENPYTFDKSKRYYIIYLDEETRSNINESQIVDCGPNGSNRQLYVWENTFTMNSPTDANSFGVNGAYMSATVNSVGWSGLGYNVDGSDTPLNLSKINDTFNLHLAVKSTSTASIEFQLIDGLDNKAYIVLGSEPYEGHAAITDFPRDGQWYNVTIPVRYLKSKFGLNFSTTTNKTGNLFVLLAGGVAGTTVDYDAVFLDGTVSGSSSDTGKLDNRKITITKAADSPFTFAKDTDYYVIYLDEETSSNIDSKHLVNIGPNGTTQMLYGWENTVSAQTATGDNSFGVASNYMSWVVENVGWSGLGYNIAAGGGVDLSNITSEYTFHFAVKSTTTNSYEYSIYDANGKGAHIILGTDKMDDGAPVGDFERDGSWYNVEVPVSWLMKQGLDFATADNFSGNIFTILGGGVAGTLIDYDAVFFYGPCKDLTAIDAVQTVAEQGVKVYTINGILVGQADSLRELSLQKGLYIVRSAQGTKKILVK